MEATEGATEMAVSTGATVDWTTVKVAVPVVPPPRTPLRSPPSPRSPVGAVAVSVDTPGSRPVAMPWEPETLDKEASSPDGPEDEVHVTRSVRSTVDPSDSRPVAVYPRVWPWVIDAIAGVTEMELRVGNPGSGSAWAESTLSAAVTPTPITTTTAAATA